MNWQIFESIFIRLTVRNLRESKKCS